VAPRAPYALQIAELPDEAAEIQMDKEAKGGKAGRGAAGGRPAMCTHTFGGCLHAAAPGASACMQTRQVQVRACRRAR